MSRRHSARRAGFASSVIAVGALVALTGCGLRPARTASPAPAGSATSRSVAPSTVAPSVAGQRSSSPAGEGGAVEVARAEQVLTEADALLARADAEAAGDQ
ncbi:MAG: hypothetical protein U0Q19_12490 [Kineosporiaceae bacterium]